MAPLRRLECNHTSHARTAGGEQLDGDWISREAAAYPAELNLYLAKAVSSLNLRSITDEVGCCTACGRPCGHAPVSAVGANKLVAYRQAACSLGAQKAIVGNFAYLDGERCLGLSCVERRFEQSAQSADSYPAICHPAPKQGRNDRTDENYGDRGRVEPGFQHGVATPCRQERPHFAQIYGEDELCRSPAKACRNPPIWPCAASILDFGTPLAEHFP